MWGIYYYMACTCKNCEAVRLGFQLNTDKTFDPSERCYACDDEVKNVDDLSILLPCQHCIHTTCVKSALSIRNKCPECDKPVERFENLSDYLRGIKSWPWRPKLQNSNILDVLKLIIYRVEKLEEETRKSVPTPQYNPPPGKNLLDSYHEPPFPKTPPRRPREENVVVPTVVNPQLFPSNNQKRRGPPQQAPRRIPVQPYVIPPRREEKRERLIEYPKYNDRNRPLTAEERKRYFGFA